MKLGIIGAMSVEIEALKEKLSDMHATRRAGMTFFEGIFEGVPAVLVVCGVGKVNAAMCAQVLCDAFQVTHIINTGVAGSLCADLDIGDFVISTEAIYHDFTCQVLNPLYVVGQVPGLSTRFFPADARLIEIAYGAAQQVNAGHASKGIVASGDQFVCSREQKAKIVEDTGAVCTEMEGAAIAHTAWRNGIPFVVIRAISDKADDSAQMDYPTFEAIAAKRSTQLTTQLVRSLQTM